MCVLPGVLVLLEQAVMEVWEEGGPRVSREEPERSKGRGCWARRTCLPGAEGLGGPGEMLGAAWQVGIGRESAEPRLPRNTEAVFFLCLLDLAVAGFFLVLLAVS